MEKIRITVTVIASCLLSLVCNAQSQEAVYDNDLRGRFSAGADWKIVKGLHMDAGYEIRVSDDFSRVERHQLNLGIEYAPIKHLKIGGGYYYIGHYDGDRDFKPRHRFYVDVTGSLKLGAWSLSLRERLQLTNNSYEFNEYQQTPNLLELKSRLKAAYKGFAHWEPYIYAELRNCFNGPSFTAQWNETGKKYTDYEFMGYSDCYINRIRGAVGVEWKITKHHSIDFKVMGDWCREKDIDTNAEGTKLKGWYWEKGFNTTFDVGYVFSF